jgi:5'-nucleotidase
MNENVEKIALFDMDGTLCDYDKSLIYKMRLLQGPTEEICNHVPRENSPLYLKERADLVRSSIEWWANLPKFQLGFDLWDILGTYDYRRIILTQGPKNNANAWTGKKLWIDKNLGQDVEITITRNKDLVYGKILVDDFPGYIVDWLKWRPRGLVIMPASEQNIDFKHKQVVRYDGTNMGEIINAINKIRF